MSGDELPAPLSVTMTLSTEQRRRLRWEPRTDGQWMRVEDERDGDEWQPVGCELVDDVDIERGEEVAVA